MSKEGDRLPAEGTSHYLIDLKVPQQTS